jgi:hypothetical protein
MKRQQLRKRNNRRNQHTLVEIRQRIATHYATEWDAHDGRLEPISIGLRPALRDRVYQFRQQASIAGLTGTTSGVGAYYAFTLASLANVSSFQNLFDLYRIVELVYVFTPIQVQINESVGASSPGAIPNLVTAIDLDGVDSAPSAQSTVQQYQTAVTAAATQQQFRVFSPRTLSTVVAGTGTAYKTNSPREWLDVANDTIQHWGIIAYLSPCAYTGQATFAVTVGATLLVREVR